MKKSINKTTTTSVTNKEVVVPIKNVGFVNSLIEAISHYLANCDTLLK